MKHLSDSHIVCVLERSSTLIHIRLRSQKPSHRGQRGGGFNINTHIWLCEAGRGAGYVCVWGGYSSPWPGLWVWLWVTDNVVFVYCRGMRPAGFASPPHRQHGWAGTCEVISFFLSFLTLQLMQLSCWGEASPCAPPSLTRPPRFPPHLGNLELSTFRLSHGVRLYFQASVLGSHKNQT